jgi:hypothetical protein
MSDKKTTKAKAKWPAQMQLLKNATAAAGQKKTSAAAKRKSNLFTGKDPQR